MNIEDKVAKLMEYKKTYYEGNPIVSDKEFDELEDELYHEDPTNKYFNIVGTNVKGGNKIKHNVVMLSMKKSKCVYLADEKGNNESVERWLNNVLDKRVSLHIGPKIDGLSSSIKYDKGKFISAVTRGDGEIGQDISYIIDYTDSIPKTIEHKEFCEIRGELYLPKDTEFDTKGKPLRNSAGGLVNRKTNREDIKYVKFVAYQLLEVEGCDLEEEKIEWLKTQGFNAISYKVVYSLEEAHKFNKDYLSHLREEWEYETDGLVITVNNNTLHEGINQKYVVSHHNFFNIALKPPSQGKETEVLDIEWTVSRHGNIIPTVIFKSITILGRKLQKASLSNYENVIRMKLEEGDKLYVSLANDVIPYVEENITKGIKQR